MYCTYKPHRVGFCLCSFYGTRKTGSPCSHTLRFFACATCSVIGSLNIAVTQHIDFRKDTRNIVDKQSGPIGTGTIAVSPGQTVQPAYCPSNLSTISQLPSRHGSRCKTQHYSPSFGGGFYAVQTSSREGELQTSRVRHHQPWTSLACRSRLGKSSTPPNITIGL